MIKTSKTEIAVIFSIVFSLTLFLYIPCFGQEKTVTLNEIVVKPKKEKYSKRNNPAVDLIKKVRDDHKKVSPFEMEEYSYEKYEKILVATTNIEYDFENAKITDKSLGFLSQYIDTALWAGKRMLDLAMLEKSSYLISSRNPTRRKEIITGYSERGIIDMLNSQNVRSSLNDVLREVDIFGNDITLLQNKFVSPLSTIGPDFYKYSITDTVYFGGQHSIEITFVPKVPETFGFNGKLFIPLEDSVKYVKRVTMRAPKSINVNYADNIYISQNFERDSIGKVHKVLDDLSLELKLFNFMPAVYGTRQIRNKGFEYAVNKSDYSGNQIEMAKEDIVTLTGASTRSEEFWAQKRTIPFSYAEKRLAGLTQELRGVRWIKWGEKILRPVLQGYVGTLPKGSKLNIGPILTFISYNDVEGIRLKVGGMSTSAFSDRVFFRGYAAYGCRDRKWKYEGEMEYSFLKKKNHSREFPMNSIRATYHYDTDQIGVRYLYSNPDNVILSIQRRKNDLIAYQRTATLEYIIELSNNLSFNTGYRHEWEESSKWVGFKNGLGIETKGYQLGSFFLKIRYAPGEEFVQSPTKRMPVNMDAPIFTILQEFGPKDLWGADFCINKTEITATKRFWLSAFGYLNVLVKGGKIWSQLPYPVLFWQNANLSYTIQKESFALLNPMEFAMDEFFSWDMEYFLNGLVFNRLPLIKRTKLREVFTFKGFFGHLSSRNNPAYHPNLFAFPGDSEIMPMGKNPYMEISAGLDNILTVLRLDYVWRLTYRNKPDISKSGIRVSLHLTF